MSVSEWKPIETAPKDGSIVLTWNGSIGTMQWIEGEGYALWIWADDILSDVDPDPEQPTHWMLPPPEPKA